MTSDRNREIYRLAVHENKTTDQLAAVYGVTAPRISQIIHRVGETKHGTHLTLKELRERESKVAADTQVDGAR